jgi:hypothetical protein
MAWLAVSAVAVASEYHGQVTFSGLPVPGTTVTATQGANKIAAVTDAQGLYSFPDLADGTWTVEIQMTGFAPIKQDVTVAPNAPAATFEMKLLTLDQIRAAAKPVKIEPTAPPVMSASAVTSPSAAPTPAKGAAAAGKAASAKGAAATQQASAAPPEQPASPPDAASQQANDGFLINGSVNNAATSQYSQSQAFGNNRGNGKSLYNGGLMLILDNSALDAKPYSLTGVALPNPNVSNLQVGLNFGGPLRIPHLMPRGPYFYIGYMRNQRSSNVATVALVPTLAERTGDLSLLPGQIYAPASGPWVTPACASAGITPGAAIPGNKIPAACISGTAKALLSFYPQPNIVGDPQYNYQVPLTTSSHADMFTLTMNKNLGNKNYVSGRVNLASTRANNPSLFGFNDPSSIFNLATDLSWYHRFTQRFSGNISYDFSRSRNQVNSNFANRLNVEGQPGVAISGVDTDPNYWGPPSLGFSSGIVGLSDGIASYNRYQTNNISLQIQWNKLRHNVAFGGDFRRQESNYLTQKNPRGSFNFTGQATDGGVATAGADVADLLLGVPDTSSIAYGNPDKYLRQSVYDLYARDDFRVNPELSINYGIRWEYGAPITETKNRLVNLDIAPGFATEAPVLANHPVGSLTGQAYPTSLVRPDKIGVAPNVSLAWRPISGSSLLIKAGYQISHDTSVYQATALAMTQQAPLSTSVSLNNANCPLTLTQGFNSCPSLTPDSFAVDPNFRVGYVQIWQLSAQRDLPGSLQALVTYQGTKGTRGVQEFMPNTYPAGGTNPCPSCASGYVYRTSNGDSTREAGIMTLRRRLRSGFTANVTYTYSKSLDDDYSFGGQGASMNGQIAQDWRNPNAQRGLSTFDQRHLLSTSLQYTTGMGLGGRTLLSGWKGLLYKEWTVLTTITAGSGLPETAIYPAAVGGAGNSSIMRANYTGAPIHGTSPGVFLNPAAFTAPALGQWGNARRDSINGPNQFALNASLARTFRLHDRYNLDVHLDANNALNHVAYTSWNTIVGSPQFGAAAAANSMRVIQATMRLRY